MRKTNPRHPPPTIPPTGPRFSEPASDESDGNEFVEPQPVESENQAATVISNDPARPGYRPVRTGEVIDISPVNGSRPLGPTDGSTARSGPAAKEPDHRSDGADDRPVLVPPVVADKDPEPAPKPPEPKKPAPKPPTRTITVERQPNPPGGVRPFGPPPPPGVGGAAPPVRRTAAEVMQDFDRNGDKVLTAEEIPPHHRGLQDADRNQDGKITLRELAAFHRSVLGLPRGAALLEYQRVSRVVDRGNSAATVAESLDLTDLPIPRRSWQT